MIPTRYIVEMEPGVWAAPGVWDVEETHNINCARTFVEEEDAADTAKCLRIDGHRAARVVQVRVTIEEDE